MIYSNKRANINFIFIFVAIRIVFNLFALPHYGFQRDELLHLALGDHLAWGYKEVPPFIALLAKLTSVFLGPSVAATRIFTTICSGFIMLLAGLLTIELGGRRFAITVACLSLTFSPAFLASGYLFQPVVFDQLWWLLSAYLLVKFINTDKVKYLYWLGVAIGIGLLTKYTMAFFTLALVIGILFSHRRAILLSRPVFIATGIAFVVFLPNVIWQLSHHIPLVTHMRKLRSTQLDYVSPTEFLKQQLLVNGAALWVWLVGLFCLLFAGSVVKYRFLGIAYLFTLVLFVVLKGKNYYLFGAYPMLFAAGGVMFERWLSPRRVALRTAAVLLFTLPNLVLFPLVLPVVPIKSALPLFAFVADKMGVDFPLIWEDHKRHATTQDYGDMFGWDELTAKVAKAYHALSPAQQRQTLIFAMNYGEAGAIHHYGKLYNLPDVISLNSSFALWAPDDITTKYMIYVDQTGGDDVKDLAPFLYKATRIGQIDNPLAREKGTAVFLLEPRPNLQGRYYSELLKTRSE